MAADLNSLHPDMKRLVVEMYGRLSLKTYTFIPVFTDRNPWIQARLWRQSRSAEEVQAAYTTLVQRGASFLAEILRSVGPQHGRWATNALPGMSWHNWKPAVALDSVLKWNGKLYWDANDPSLVTSADKNYVRDAYTSYVEIGQELGLTSMAKIHDIGHMQLYDYEIPHKYSYAEISKAMEVAWGSTEPK